MHKYEHDPDFLLAILGPFIMIQIALITRIFLSKTARFSTYAPERQRAIAGLVAVLAGKLLLVYLTVPTLFGDWTTHKTLDVRRATIVFTVIYTFDITFRKTSFGLWVHHIMAVATVITMLCYCNYDASDYFSGRMITIFQALATGLADIMADFSIFTYYAVEYSSTTAALLTIWARLSGLIRMVQWSLIFHLCYSTPLSWQMALVLITSVWFAKEELHEYKVISGIAAKVQRIVSDQMFHSPEIWEPSSPVRAWFDDNYKLWEDDWQNSSRAIQ